MNLELDFELWNWIWIQKTHLERINIYNKKNLELYWLATQYTLSLQNLENKRILQVE
jgi:hypothetical protein